MGKTVVEQVTASFAFTHLPGGGTSSVSDTFEDSEALVDMVDDSGGDGIVAMASFAGVIGLVASVPVRTIASAARLGDVPILVAVAFSLADALEVAAGMEKETMAMHHGKEDTV